MQAALTTESTDLAAFRDEVASFLDAEANDLIREAGKKTTSVFSPFDQAQEFVKILNTKGWSGVAWPKEYGGTGWSIEQQNIFSEECRKRELPSLLPNALQMVGPAIMKYGTDEQKQKYLPPILSGDDYWAQGYSEPNAGSDLVSLKCRAVREGDEYVINGSKIWTTFAHLSNRLFMLVKTDVECRPQAGITFLLVDSLDLPGMEVRPIVGLDGELEQCEVFFDNVRVPVSSVLGEENKGWSVAKYLLEHERGGGAGFSWMLKQELDRCRLIAEKLGDGQGGLIVDDPYFQKRFAELSVDIRSVLAIETKLSSMDMGSPESPMLSSLQKVYWTELSQKISEFSIDTCGTLSLPLQLQALAVGSGVEPIGVDEALTVTPRYLNNHATSIFGGTNEIQRDIIAKSLLAGCGI